MKKFYNSGQFQKGGISINKGKTKYTDSSIMSAALKRLGQKREVYFISCPICGIKFNQFGIKSHIQFSHIKSNPFKGRRHTEESKQKNREKHLGKPAWNSGITGYTLNIFNIEEKNKNISIGNKKRWERWKREGVFISTATFKYGSEWNKALRKLIREKHNKQCFDCGVSEQLRRLSVHHIDNNKLNCNESNLVPLCASCHMKRHRKGVKIKCA